MLLRTIGERLRAEREKRGIPVAKIAAELRIHAHYLEAIEEGDAERLPGDFFYRAFVRQYARYLSLNEEQIERELEALKPPPAPPAGEEEKFPIEVPPEGPSRYGEMLRSLPWSVITLILVLTGGAAVYSVWLNRTPGEMPPAPVAESRPPASQPGAATPPQLAAEAPAPASPAAASTAAPSAAPPAAPPTRRRCAWLKPQLLMKANFILRGLACGALAALLFVAGGCTTVPVTGRSQLNLLSPGQELQLGLSAFNDLKKSTPISKDAAANAKAADAHWMKLTGEAARNEAPKAAEATGAE